MKTATLNVGGMTCEGCVASVSRALRGVSGVAQVEVSLAQATAKVEFDPALVSSDQLRQAVENAGFDVTP